MVGYWCIPTGSSVRNVSTMRMSVRAAVKNDRACSGRSQVGTPVTRTMIPPTHVPVAGRNTQSPIQGRSRTRHGRLALTGRRRPRRRRTSARCPSSARHSPHYTTTARRGRDPPLARPTSHDLQLRLACRLEAATPAHRRASCPSRAVSYPCPRTSTV